MKASEVGAIYSNIDYQLVPALPRATRSISMRNIASNPQPATSSPTARPKSISMGKKNYVYVETRGRGHLMGVTLGVLQNRRLDGRRRRHDFRR